MAKSTSCPCGSDQAYTDCCGPYHQGELPATAESLMRSRYSAYALGLTEYLRQSWHPEHRPATLELDPELRWFRLQICNTHAGGLADAEGTVHFIARYRRHGRAGRLEENSRFVRLDGRWYYLDGAIKDS